MPVSQFGPRNRSDGVSIHRVHGPAHVLAMFVVGEAAAAERSGQRGEVRSSN